MGRRGRGRGDCSGILQEVGSEAVDEGAQGQAAGPGGSEVAHAHALVAVRLLLAPRL